MRDGRADSPESRRIAANAPEGIGAHPDVRAILAAILASLGEIRAAVAPELDARARLLAALRGAFGDTVFASLDVLEAAAVQPDGELGRAVAALIGAPEGGLRRLARRLAKAAGKPAGGLVLARVATDRDGALYVVQTA